jgi:hypothetical protein
MVTQGNCLQGGAARQDALGSQAGGGGRRAGCVACGLLCSLLWGTSQGLFCLPRPACSLSAWSYLFGALPPSSGHSGPWAGWRVGARRKCLYTHPHTRAIPLAGRRLAAHMHTLARSRSPTPAALARSHSPAAVLKIHPPSHLHLVAAAASLCGRCTLKAGRSEGARGHLRFALLTRCVPPAHPGVSSVAGPYVPLSACLRYHGDPTNLASPLSLPPLCPLRRRLRKQLICIC